MSHGRERFLTAKGCAGKRPRSASQSSLLFAHFRSDGLAELLQDNQYACIFGGLMRTVVREEIDRAFSGVRTSSFLDGVPSKQVTKSSAREFRLRFKTNPAAESFTKNNLVDEQGDSICVMLIDTATGQHITTGPESATKVEVVPLMGDFDTPERQEWSAEEFDRHVVRKRKDIPLLAGDLNVHLKDGRGTLGQIHFTDNSSFTRNKKFRLGVRVAPDDEHRLLSIREGKSEAFRVKEKRGKEYKKHGTPFPTDAVWRLRKIKKKGPYDTRLRQKGIITVGHFLSSLESTPSIIKDVFGTMSEKFYQETIDHAKECILSDDNVKECIIKDKLFIYDVKQPPYKSLIFNANRQFMGAVVDRQYGGFGMVADTQRVCTDGLVKIAYDHWGTEVTELMVEKVPEPSMIEKAPGIVDGSLANNMIDAAAATPQKALDGAIGAKEVPGLQPIRITGQDHVDTNVMAGCTSQGQSSGFDMEHLSDDLHTQLEGLHSSIAYGEVTSKVHYVMRPESGEPFKHSSLQEPKSAARKWWLPICCAIRWALFIRNNKSDARAHSLVPVH